MTNSHGSLPSGYIICPTKKRTMHGIQLRENILCAKTIQDTSNRPTNQLKPIETNWTQLNPIDWQSLVYHAQPFLKNPGMVIGPAESQAPILLVTCAWAPACSSRSVVFMWPKRTWVRHCGWETHGEAMKKGKKNRSKPWKSSEERKLWMNFDHYEE